MPLTPDAQAELNEAIRIVREDKFESFARSALGKYTPPKDVPKDPPTDPLLDPDEPPTPPKKEPIADPPPKKDQPNPPDEPPKRKHAYWGELLD